MAGQVYCLCFHHLSTKKLKAHRHHLNLLTESVVFYRARSVTSVSKTKKTAEKQNTEGGNGISPGKAIVKR